MDPIGQMYQREYYIAVMTDHEEYREFGAAGTSGNVLSIDIEIRPDAKERLLVFDNVELMQGDTRSTEIVNEVAKRDPIDLLFIDESLA